MWFLPLSYHLPLSSFSPTGSVYLDAKLQLLEGNKLWQIGIPKIWLSYNAPCPIALAVMMHVVQCIAGLDALKIGDATYVLPGQRTLSFSGLHM